MSQKLTEEKTKKLQGSIRLEIAKKQMQVELIKQDCWDSAKTQTRGIFSFSGETSVENFAVLQDEACNMEYLRHVITELIEMASSAGRDPHPHPHPHPHPGTSSPSSLIWRAPESATPTLSSK